MYYRIKIQLDAELLAEEFISEEHKNPVMKRIKELIETLDLAYGAERKSHDMGGYILYFPDVQTYQKSIGKIEEFHHISQDLREYADTIAECGQENAEWIEELYLLTSEDSLVLIYPKEKGHA